MTDSFDLAAFRGRFASLQTLTYLNSGSYGLLADTVAAAFGEYLAVRVERGADWAGWVAAQETVRSLMSALLQVDADEVAITGSASAGINAIASAMDFRGPRNKVLVSNFEFPTSAQIWHAQERAGARLIHVAEREGGVLPVEHFERLIDDETALVVLSQVCYRNGGRIPDEDIRTIGRLAHARGALVMLDTYQIVGTENIQPRTLGVDMCVGGMLKYLLGSAGVGFLYVRGSLIEDLIPRNSGWFAQADIDAMDIFANVPNSSARRFEAGTPSVASCLACAAGLKLVLEIGLDAIGTQVRSVTRYALDALRDAKIRVDSPDADTCRGPLIAIPSLDPAALVAALMEQKIVTSYRDGRLRAGFHAYNDAQDADAFVAALVEHRHLLAA